eukprot:CAMPEP_0176414628 /NCGR_PEP_ID=MMETSP0127-20121128/5362_1 /TAXON_ID=938130 /ORGANISM="Platyophrya macrostoma, Strain WH" /LENGTH=82 /DNA_ID=CAMNT_0017794545 /DNA_START=39 /DNA_END=287 /DNA_ORIENTATION=-
MVYYINDFTGAMIGLLVVYVTAVFTHRWTTHHDEDAVLGAFVGFPFHYGYSAVFVIVPVLVWFFYQLLLILGPKGTSKAIKV